MKLWLQIMAIAVYGFFFIGIMLTSTAAWLCGPVTWWRLAAAFIQFLIGLGGVVAGAIFLFRRLP